MAFFDFCSLGPFFFEGILTRVLYRVYDGGMLVVAGPWTADVYPAANMHGCGASRARLLGGCVALEV